VSLVIHITFEILLTSVICSEGKGRVTIFAAQSNARTFDYQVNSFRSSPIFHSDTLVLAKAGDIGMEQTLVQLPQLLTIYLNRLRPCKHGYGDV